MKKERFTTISLKIECGMLLRLDVMAKTKDMSRSALIRSALKSKMVSYEV